MHVEAEESAEDGAWISATSYWQPRWLMDSAWHRHAPFAFWLVDAIRPSSIVELGTHNGFSFFVFCEAIARLRLRATASAIDTWVGDEHAGFYGEEVYEEVSRIRQTFYPTIALLHRGYFDDFVQRWPDGDIDLLHIDGRHRYEDIRHDFTSWLPKLSEQGIVLFHDTAEHANGFGVWRFWEEVRERYPSFEFRHGHGLGVLAVGTTVPPRLSTFFAAADRQAEEIRARYEGLGAEVTRPIETEVARERAVQAVARCEQELATVQEQLQAALRDRDALLDSTSWRVTAPLRAVGAVLKRR